MVHSHVERSASVSSPSTRAADLTRLPHHYTTCLRAAISMGWREIVRFLRQRNRVIGAVGQPILFWVLFGAGMNQSFQVPGQPFQEYFVPGIVVLILLFTAIFATISIIEDRQEGFLQSVLVAPVPRWTFVFGKIAGGAILAVAQGFLFLLLALTLGMELTFLSAIAALLLMILIAIGLTSLGFCLAWRLDSTQGFHAIMNLLLMPMWLLSGAFFPVPRRDAAATVGEQTLHWLMRCNPVTYAVSGLRQIFMTSTSSPSLHDSNGLSFAPPFVLCWTVTGIFAVVMMGLATHVARNSTQGDLR